MEELRAALEEAQANTRKLKADKDAQAAELRAELRNLETRNHALNLRLREIESGGPGTATGVEPPIQLASDRFVKERPSAFGNMNGSGGALLASYQEEEMPPFLCLRPFVLPPALPLEVLFPAFGDAKDMCWGSMEPLPAAIKVAAKLCLCMAKFFATEDGRRNAAIEILRPFLATDSLLSLEREVVMPNNYRADGAVFFRDDNATHLIVKLSLKRELADSFIQSARFFQANLDYERDRLSQGDVCPCVLLQIAGPHLRLCGLASQTDAMRRGDGDNEVQLQPRVTCEPLSPFHDLLFAPHRTTELVALARTLVAFKAAAQAVDAHYQSPLQRVDPLMRALPFALRGPEFRLASPLVRNRLVFSATLVSGSGAAGGGQPVAVKLVPPGRYGEATHRLWAADGLAPSLHAASRLPGGHTLVTMDLLHGAWVGLDTVDIGQRRSDVKAAVLRALCQGHRLTLPCGGRPVHGDVRAGNIMVCETDGGALVRFVDFDWSGAEGVARYPALIAMNVPRADGVGPGELMAQAHDIDSVEFLFPDAHAGAFDDGGS